MASNQVLYESPIQGPLQTKNEPLLEDNSASTTPRLVNHGILDTLESSGTEREDKPSEKTNAELLKRVAELEAQLRVNDS